jgi:hypothetical protein
VTILEWAELLNGREYGLEITKEEETQAWEDSVYIIFGASDDLIEIRGQETEELGCFEGGVVMFNGDGILTNECEDPQCPYWQKLCDTAKEVEAVWDSEGYSWTYKTDIPHATFDIMEDGEKYCRGIVFHKDSLS